MLKNQHKTLLLFECVSLEVEKKFRLSSQKVYGIICLNSPSKSLVEKVNANPMIILFEYAVAFNEVVSNYSVTKQEKINFNENWKAESK